MTLLPEMIVSLLLVVSSGVALVFAAPTPMFHNENQHVSTSPYQNSIELQHQQGQWSGFPPGSSMVNNLPRTEGFNQNQYEGGQGSRHHFETFQPGQSSANSIPHLVSFDGYPVQVSNHNHNDNLFSYANAYEPQGQYGSPIRSPIHPPSFTYDYESNHHNLLSSDVYPWTDSHKSHDVAPNQHYDLGDFDQAMHAIDLASSSQPIATQHPKKHRSRRAHRKDAELSAPSESVAPKSSTQSTLQHVNTHRGNPYSVRSHRRWEYTLPIKSDFPFTSLDDIVWPYLSIDQKQYILQRIHRIRPRKLGYLRHILAETLRVQAARDLLSPIGVVADDAVEKLFPTPRARKEVVKTWMSDLSDWKRIEVIDNMAAATMQEAGKLRDLFLNKNVTPALALEILHASEEECRRIAEEKGLFVDDKETALPWQKGTNKLQRAALLHRMKANGTEKGVAYHLLDKNHIPPGYGLRLLRVGDDDFRDMVESMRGSAKFLIL
ncbi:hypothetical protein CBS101457_000201 [Exobasidium rhododendri]|nr:hypothetical protein CBS101457_000201 [Exobasidium rhododendri]